MPPTPLPSPSDRIRVLRIIARLNVGGPAVLAEVLSEGLDPRRFEQLLLAGSVGPDEADFVELRAPGLAVERVPGLGRAVNATGDVRALHRIHEVIRTFRPHIVDTRTAKAGVLGRLAAFVNRVPATVHTYHGHLLHGYFSPTKTRAVVAVERTLARRTSRLVAEGRNVRDELVAAGIGRADQYSVIPPGLHVATAPTSAEARRRLQLDGTGAVVGFVARLTRVKRPDRFLAVAAEVARSHPDTMFVVAGEGDLLDESQARVRANGMGPRVRFLGWRPDVETIYAACDVVVLTSDNEGMPYSLIEAALCGTPAVTTRVGSAPEVVIDGSTGFVTSTNVADIAAALNKLLDDSALRRRMGEAAASRARQEFSTERVVTDVAELYEGVLATVRAR